LRDIAAKNPPCTVTDSKKVGIVAKNTQIPPRAARAHRQESAHGYEKAIANGLKGRVSNYWKIA
jgi:hypothetical protein